MISSDPIPLPRLKIINCQQMLLRTVDVEQLIEPDHAARCIWEFVGRLNLDCFFRSIRSIEGYAGRSALDPQLLISLWIYAYSRGVGSAREISRLCEIDPAFQWLTGMESINHPTCGWVWLQ
jgi:transposase